MHSDLVTVFGGSGFIGRHVVRQLARAGFRLRVAVRRPNLAQFLLPMGRVGQIQLVAANLGHEASIARALEGASVVVNLAGILSPWGAQDFATVHVDGPRLIGSHAAIKGVSRIIHISAIGADANAPSAYGRSKAEGEAQLRAAFENTTVLRPSVVFGAEDQFFNRFANMARYSPVLPLIGGGHTKFQPVFAGDVAAAVLRAIEDPATARHTYELGGPEVKTFRALMTYILAEIGRKRALVSVPFPIAMMQGFFFGLLPNPILTVDQVRQLRRDNVVGIGPDADSIGTLADLGIKPINLEAVVPGYLWRFRKAGQFEGAQPVG